MNKKTKYLTLILGGLLTLTPFVIKESKEIDLVLHERKKVDPNSIINYIPNTNKINFRTNYSTLNDVRYVSSITKFKANTTEQTNQNIDYQVINTVINTKIKPDNTNIVQHIHKPVYVYDSKSKSYLFSNKTIYKLRNGYNPAYSNQLFTNAQIYTNNKAIIKNLDRDFGTYSFISTGSKLYSNSSKLLLDENLTTILNTSKKEYYLVNSKNIVTSAYNYSDRMYYSVAKTRRASGKVAYNYNTKQTISGLRQQNNTLYSPYKNIESYGSGLAEYRGSANASVSTRNSNNVPASLKIELTTYPSRVFTVNKTINYDNSAWSYKIKTGKIALGTTSQKFHPGLDIMGFNGQYVRAAFEGKVIHSGTYNDKNALGGFYNYVVVAYPVSQNLTYRVTYAHLKSSPTKYVSRGTVVYPGQVLGISGNTGNSSKAHLHTDVEVAITNISNYFNNSSLATKSTNNSKFADSRVYGNTNYMKNYKVVVNGISVYRVHPETFYNGMNN